MVTAARLLRVRRAGARPRGGAVASPLQARRRRGGRQDLERPSSSGLLRKPLRAIEEPGSEKQGSVESSSGSGADGDGGRTSEEILRKYQDDDVGLRSSEGPSSSSSSSGAEAEPEADFRPVSLARTDGAAPKSLAEYEREFAAADEDKTAVQKFLFPDKEELPDDVEMSIWEHLDELRERVLVSVIGVGALIVGCFGYSKQLVNILEAPVADKGVKFLQLSPGEFFFTSFKVAGYTGLLLGAPLILYEVIAFVLPGLTVSERKFLGPIVLGSSVLFYVGLLFSYGVLTPAALTFFVSYADGAVESLWSIDKYFEFVLVLMLSTGLSFQVPVIQLLLGQTGLVSSETMFAAWRYVVVGAVVAAAVLTPSTDPFTQTLLAAPLIGLYLGGAGLVRLVENQKQEEAT